MRIELLCSCSLMFVLRLKLVCSCKTRFPIRSEAEYLSIKCVLSVFLLLCICSKELRQIMAKCKNMSKLDYSLRAAKHFG
jgi:hypothetical protein